jgi:hypothetical protein
MASKIVMMTTRRISPGPPADRPAVLQLRSAFVVARATPPHQEDDHVPLAVRNITFSSADPERLADFWAAATGYTRRRDSAEEVLLAADDWSFPRLDFQHSPTPTSGPGRVHLDLTAADMAAEVDRLIDLGATELWTIDTAQSGTTTWTTMADPDGNQFCVVQQPPGD